MTLAPRTYLSRLAKNLLLQYDNTVFCLALSVMIIFSSRLFYLNTNFHKSIPYSSSFPKFQTSIQF